MSYVSDIGLNYFHIERFEMSIRTLLTFCKGTKSNKYFNFIFEPSNSCNVKHCIYKGSFVEAVEYLYGFIPEVFKEYCKQFNVEIETRDGTAKTIGYIDLLNSMKSVNKISLEHVSLLNKVYSTRGKVIHNTLISKEVYYKNLSWIAIQLDRYDLNDLYKYVIGLCEEINKSYEDGVKGSLTVKLKKLSSNNSKTSEPSNLRNSNVW